MEIQGKELENRGWERDKRNGEGKWKKRELEKKEGRKGKSPLRTTISH